MAASFLGTSMTDNGRLVAQKTFEVPGVSRSAVMEALRLRRFGAVLSRAAEAPLHPNYKSYNFWGYRYRFKDSWGIKA